MSPVTSSPTLAQRVLTVLNGERGAEVPFTMYENKIPQNAVERELRNRGLCIINRRVPVYKMHQPNVTVHSESIIENGKQLVKTIFDTPVGSVHSISEPAGFTTWYHKRLFQSPDDYQVLKFLIDDMQYEPYYEAWVKAEKAASGDILFRAGFGSEPLQTLISGNMMDMQDFCIQWMDNRDEILKLYDALVEKRRLVYPIVARSPAYHANYGGNVVPEVIGKKTFDQYYVQHYNEAAEIMHRHGKKIGCHFDANCHALAESIAQTDLDYIEAFTPAPDTDMTLRNARAAWPNKVIWLNFPSSLHLKNDSDVEQATVDLLNELNSIDGVIMGITEDMPEERGLYSCRAIMNGLARHAKDHPDMYGKT